MEFYKLIFIILIVFLKTGNVLSKESIFNVNNIKLEKKANLSNKKLADQAIRKGFGELVKKILLDEDIKQLSELKLSQIKELVSYYQVVNKIDDSNNIDMVSFNISFDKDKLHNLFYAKGISYSEIIDKELFLLPILKKNNQMFVYNQNFFYDKWNEIYNNDLIEFVLPLENIEIIEKINFYKNNLLNLELSDLFKEYSDKNLALLIIENNNLKEEKIYFKIKILGKNFVKKITLQKSNLSQKEFNIKIITESKKEIINIIKSQHLIDIRTPSFINAHLNLNNNSNLVLLNERLKKIDLIENIYIQEFNNKSVYLKIKYLGKLDKIIRQLKEQKIILKLIGDQWRIKII
jgi:hypothetical protein